MKCLVLLLIMVFVLSGCSSTIRPPGQVVASENNFENGLKQYERGHIRQAIHQFEKAIEKNPANFRAYFYLGLCHKQKGALKAARKNFQKAIDLNPNDQSWIMKVKAEMETPGPKKGKKK